MAVLTGFLKVAGSAGKKAMTTVVQMAVPMAASKVVLMVVWMGAE